MNIKNNIVIEYDFFKIGEIEGYDLIFGESDLGDPVVVVRKREGLLDIDIGFLIFNENGDYYLKDLSDKEGIDTPYLRVYDIEKLDWDIYGIKPDNWRPIEWVNKIVIEGVSYIRDKEEDE